MSGVTTWSGTMKDLQSIINNCAELSCTPLVQFTPHDAFKIKKCTPGIDRMHPTLEHSVKPVHYTYISRLTLIELDGNFLCPKYRNLPGFTCERNFCKRAFSKMYFSLKSSLHSIVLLSGYVTALHAAYPPDFPPAAHRFRGQNRRRNSRSTYIRGLSGR